MELANDYWFQYMSVGLLYVRIAVFSFVTFMKLALHSGIGITPGVKILSELPRFTLIDKCGMPL